MWNRCHWRLLYQVKTNNSALFEYLSSIDRLDALEFFQAMNENDAIYTFAKKCGSWDWLGIGIMLLCCKCEGSGSWVAFFGSYILLWIIGGIMHACKKNETKSD